MRFVSLATLSLPCVLSQEYNIGIIADLDKNSKTEEDGYMSYLKKGTLTRDGDAYSVVWNSLNVLQTSEGVEGRGAELSELDYIGTELYTIDDKTGIVYEIKGFELVPWVTLYADDGTDPDKLFKGEWMTSKDGIEYVGSHGIDFTKTAWIKKVKKYVSYIDDTAIVTNVDWNSHYDKVKETLDVPDEGYVTHEAVAWSETNQLWYFLPRKVSKTRYNPKDDERSCSNVMITADSSLENMEVFTVGELDTLKGFSTFKFVPGTDDTHIVALKSTEMEDPKYTATYITVFDIGPTLDEPSGSPKVLLQDELITEAKYEGIAFIHPKDGSAKPSLRSSLQTPLKFSLRGS